MRNYHSWTIGSTGHWIGRPGAAARFAARSKYYYYYYRPAQIFLFRRQRGSAGCERTCTRQDLLSVSLHCYYANLPPSSADQTWARTDDHYLPRATTLSQSFSDLVFWGQQLCFYDWRKVMPRWQTSFEQPLKKKQLLALVNRLIVLIVSRLIINQ